MKKVIKFTTIGDEKVLKVVKEPVRDPGYGEVLIDVSAFAINRSEIMFREGLYIQRPIFPSKIGYEAAGIIKAVGEGVKIWKVGDRVTTLPLLKMSIYGVWAESAIVPAKALVTSPENLNDIETASVWISFITAWGALIDIGNIQQGDHILITAGAGTPGLAAIQIAKKHGAIPIVTTRTHTKKEKLLKLGASHVIVTDEEKIENRIDDITNGRGVRVIFDSVSGSGIESLAEAASMNGIIIVYGMLSNEPTPFPIFSAFEKGLTIRGFTIKEVLEDPGKWQKAESYLRHAFNKGTLKPTISKIFTFDNFIEALLYMKSSEKIGKVVVITI